VNVSILGCYINLAHPEDEELNKLLDSFKEHIRFARDFGCSIVGTETGALNKEYVYTPQNNTEKAFQRTLNSIKILVEEAEKFGVFVAIEGVAKHVINTPERMKRVIDNVQSNNLQVIFDPVNLIDESNYHKQDDIIRSSFELFGDRIVAIHAKDYVYEDGKIKLATIGRGQFNYPLLLSLIKERKPYIDVLLENTTQNDIDESIKYIKETYNRV
jgi:sugar phosphate isomerase/epimerase